MNDIKLGKFFDEETKFERTPSRIRTRFIAVLSLLLERLLPPLYQVSLSFCI